MADLVLDSLEIRGFRAFRHLTIEKLGRVNLIVGKNNVGKTALLEALRIYAERGSLQVMQEILAARQESRGIYFSALNAPHAREWVSSFGSLFYGRPNPLRDSSNFRIGPIGPIENREVVLSVSQSWASGLLSQRVHEGEAESDEELPKLEIRFGEHKVVYRLLTETDYFRPSVVPSLKNEFIPVGGLNANQATTLWDSISLTDAEDDVLAALHLIAPEVRRVNLLGYSDSDKSQPIIPKVRTTNSDKPVPLGSLGEGMNRLFGLSLALANAENGLLLVDEIETGLHYSVQPDMWRLVFETARRLDVQVFATTHSYDCVRAFEKIALEHPEEGVVVRLYRDKNGDVKQTLYDEEDLEVVAAQDIEVR